MPTYAEKLKDPRWQKKRLQILDRDEWTCKLCGDTETQLHIHHFYYHRDKEPWEYEIQDLTTYCKHCHYLVEVIKDQSSIQSIISVIKYLRKSDNTLTIIAIVLGLQNDIHACLFTYDNTTSEICFSTSLPENIVTQLSREINIIKEKNNNA